MRGTLAVVMTLLLIASAAPLGSGAESGAAFDVSSRPGMEDETVLEMERSRGDLVEQLDMTFDERRSKLLVEYHRDSGDDEFLARLEVAFHQLVEYRDVDGDGSFDDDDDEVVASYTLGPWANDPVDEQDRGDAEWRDTRVEETEADDGSPGKLMHARAELPGDQGAFVLDLAVFGATTTYNGIQLGPGEAKLDLWLQQVPRERDTNRFALMMEVISAQESESVAESDGHTVSQNHGDVLLHYTWSQVVSVDGEESDVDTRLLKEHTSQTNRQTNVQSDGEGQRTKEQSTTRNRLFALSYPAGDQVVHDPILGLADLFEAALTNETEEPATNESPNETEEPEEEPNDSVIDATATEDDQEPETRTFQGGPRDQAAEDDGLDLWNELVGLAPALAIALLAGLLALLVVTRSDD